MKRKYFAPMAEKVEFKYSDQVVASGLQCTSQYKIDSSSGDACPPCNSEYIGKTL